MLRDHRYKQERWAQAARRHRQNIKDYGEFFGSFAPDWIMTITFGGERAPSRKKARREVEAYLRDLQRAAGHPIAWIIAEDYGSGRLHFHVLVVGVAHLNRGEWWRISYERFGRTNIDVFDGQRGGAGYVAKNALAKHGDFDFGGDLLAERNKTPEGFVGAVSEYRASRKKLGGRPRIEVDAAAIEAIDAARRRGDSWRKISKDSGIGVGTLLRRHAEWQAELAGQGVATAQPVPTSPSRPKTPINHMPETAAEAEDAAATGVEGMEDLMDARGAALVLADQRWFFERFKANSVITLAVDLKQTNGRSGALGQVHALLGEIQRSLGSLAWVLAEKNIRRRRRSKLYVEILLTATPTDVKRWLPHLRALGQARIGPFLEPSAPRYLVDLGYPCIHFGGELFETVHEPDQGIGSIVGTQGPRVESVYIAGKACRSDGTNSAFAYITESSEDEYVEWTRDQTRDEATFAAALAFLEKAPKGTRVRIVTHSLVFFDRFNEFAGPGGPTLVRFWVRIGIAIRRRRLTVMASWVPRRDNPAATLLFRKEGRLEATNKERSLSL